MKKKLLLKITVIISLLLTTAYSYSMEERMAAHYARPSEDIPTLPLQTLTLPNGQEITLSIVHNPTHYRMPKKSLEQEISLLKKVLYRGAHTGMEDNCWVSAYTPREVLAGTVVYEMDTSELYVHFLAIDPEYQKKGIGRALMSFLEKTPDCKTIQLDSLKSSEEFYKKLGYRQEKENGSFKKNIS